jgi:hypothetical protein
MKRFSLFTKFVLALGLSTVCLSSAKAMQGEFGKIASYISFTTGSNNGALSIETINGVLRSYDKYISQAKQIFGKETTLPVAQRASIFTALVDQCYSGWLAKLQIFGTNPSNSKQFVAESSAAAAQWKQQQLDWLNAAVVKLQPQILPAVGKLQVSGAAANKGTGRGFATRILSLATKYPTLSGTVAVAACAYLGLSYGAQFIPVK